MRATNWLCGPFDLDVSKPVIVGICNVTPDSFSDGGHHSTADKAIAYAHQLIEQGADIIDVGGESTRPGSEEVSVQEELQRVYDVVRTLAAQGVKVSVDTRHAEVARACVQAGACIINDVSGFTSQEMRDVAAQCDAGLIVMHMRGKPQSMQNNPVYGDVVSEVEEELMASVNHLLDLGVNKQRICLDYGIGFGKTLAHNQQLIDATEHFAQLGFALMAAISRKSYIGSLTNEDNPQQRDRASALCSAFMASLGATVIRSHNVALTGEMLKYSRRAVISLGSNMGDSIAQLDEAITNLRSYSDIWVGIVSDYVTSKPAYKEDQDDFVNAVAVIQTTLSPHELLDVLHEIEQKHGRKRTIENGPRTLDLDIVDFEGVVLNTPNLILPHSKAHERDFVVSPLLNIMSAYELANGAKLSKENVKVGRVCSLIHKKDS